MNAPPDLAATRQALAGDDPQAQARAAQDLLTAFAERPLAVLDALDDAPPSPARECLRRSLDWETHQELRHGRPGAKFPDEASRLKSCLKRLASAHAAAPPHLRASLLRAAAEAIEGAGDQAAACLRPVLTGWGVGLAPQRGLVLDLLRALAGPTTPAPLVPLLTEIALLSWEVGRFEEHLVAVEVLAQLQAHPDGPACLDAASAALTTLPAADVSLPKKVSRSFKRTTKTLTNRTQRRLKLVRAVASGGAERDALLKACRAADTPGYQRATKLRALPALRGSPWPRQVLKDAVIVLSAAWGEAPDEAVGLALEGLGRACEAQLADADTGSANHAEAALDAAGQALDALCSTQAADPVASLRQVNAARACARALGRAARWPFGLAARRRLLAGLAPRSAPYTPPGSQEWAFAGLERWLPGAADDDRLAAFEHLSGTLRRPPSPDDLQACLSYLSAWTCYDRIFAAAQDKALAARAGLELRALTTGAPPSSPQETSRALALAYLRAAPAELCAALGPTCALDASLAAGPAPADLVWAARDWVAAYRARLDAHLHDWEALSPAQQVWAVRSAAYLILAPPRSFRPALDEASCPLPLRPDPSDSEHLPAALQLLESIPAQVAAAIDDEVRRAIEARPQPETSPDPVLLDLARRSRSFVVAGGLALELHRALLRGGQRPDFDPGRLIYRTLLASPNPAVFEHLAARTSDPSTSGLSLLLAGYTRTLLAWHQSRDLGGARLAEVKEHIGALLAGLDSGVLSSQLESARMIRAVLSSALGLLEVNVDTWERLVDGLPQLFGHLDQLLAFRVAPASEPLSETCATELAGLADGARFYGELAFQQFSAREEQLDRLLRHLDALDSKLADHPDLAPPELTLVALVTSVWRRCLTGVKKTYVLRARRLYQVDDPDTFHVEFLAEAKPPPWTIPPTPSQVESCERFLAEWISARLDVCAIQRTLAQRWSPAAQTLYRLATRPWVALGVVGSPFAIALACSRGGESSALFPFRGGGFLLATLGVVLGFLALVGLSAWRQLRPAGSALGTGPRLDGKPFYALLPRLFKLMASFMALLVFNDPAYVMPVSSSDGLLVLLLVATALSTSFVLGREVSETGTESTRPERPPRRALPVMALALLESFAIALFLSLFFATHYFEAHGGLSAATSEIFSLGMPKEIRVDAVGLAFYPPLLLVWTAWGLFLGVCWQGFFDDDMDGKP